MFGWLRDKIGGSLVQRWIGDIVRYVLVLVFAELARRSVITQDDAAKYTTELVAVLVPLAWQFYQRYGDRLKFEAARALPPGAAGWEIEEKAASAAIKDKAFK